MTIMYHHINSIHIVYIMSRMVLMGVLAGLLGLLLIGTVPFIVENIVWWHIYVHDLHCPSFVFHIIKLPEMMIYMRPWQLIYNIWYTRCIKLWYLVFLLIISCIYTYIYLYYIFVAEYFLNPSWYHLYFNTNNSGSVFFVDRQNLLQDMPPSFAFLGVRSPVNPDGETWRPQNGYF